MTHSRKAFDVLILRAPNQFLLSKITPNISYALFKKKFTTLKPNSLLYKCPIKTLSYPIQILGISIKDSLECIYDSSIHQSLLNQHNKFFIAKAFIGDHWLFIYNG
jgi:hypothetical protein